MSSRTDDQSRRLLWEVIRPFDVVLLATHADGSMHARPMVFCQQSFEGDLWFLADARSRKVADIAAEPAVLVCFSDLAQGRFVSAAGRAEIVRDAGLIEALWCEELAAWLPHGPESPELALLKVRVTSAERWDSVRRAMIPVYGRLPQRAVAETLHPGAKGIDFGLW